MRWLLGLILKLVDETGEKSDEFFLWKPSSTVQPSHVMEEDAYLTAIPYEPRLRQSF